MYNNKNDKQASISLNEITNDSDSTSWYQRGKNLVLRVGAPLLLAVVAGCSSAKHYVKNDYPEFVAHSAQCMTTQYEGLNNSNDSFLKLDDNLFQLFVDTMEGAKKVDDYKTPDNFEAVKSRHGDYGAVLTAMDTQNQMLAALSETRLARLVAYQLKKNVSHDKLDNFVYSPSEVELIKKELGKLSAEMGKVSFEQRQQLEKLMRRESDPKVRAAYEELQKYNEAQLRRVYVWNNASADIASIEGLVDEVDKANNVCNAIYWSLKGVDQAQLGEKALKERLFKEKVKDVVSPKSMFAELYDADDGEMTVEQVYNDIMAQIKEEAEDWVDESRNDICNDYLASILNLAFEANRHGKLDDLEFQGVVKYVTGQALDAMGNNPQRSNVFDAWSVAPLVSFLYPLRFHALRTAFSPDSFTPEAVDAAKALEQTLRNGNAIKIGAKNREWFAGNTGNRQTELVMSLISDILQIGGVVGGSYAATQTQEKAAASTNPVTQGGETGGPGTKN